MDILHLPLHRIPSLKCLFILFLDLWIQDHFWMTTPQGPLQWKPFHCVTTHSGRVCILMEGTYWGGAKVDLRWCLPVTCPSTTHPLVSLLSTPLYPPISILKFPRCAGDRLCSFALSSGWAMRKGSTRLGWVDHIQTYATLIPRILVNLTAPSTKYAECRK